MKLHALATSVIVASAAALLACSSTTTSTPSASASDSDAAPSVGASDDAGTPPTDTPDAASSCAAPPSKSGCGIEGSWVRGVARFDPSKLKPTSKPVLRAVLRHQFIMVKGEETIGGRLHAFDSFPVKDPTRGEQAFALDMCGLGTAMWSEENGAFHLVLILDENGDNDLENATSNETALVIGMPSPGELVKMVDVDVSCKAAPSCLDVKVDCTGSACLAITPIKTCKKTLPGCVSDDVFCQ